MAAPAMAAEASPLDSLGDLGTTAEGLKSNLPALSSTSIDLSELTKAAPVAEAVVEGAARLHRSHHGPRAELRAGPVRVGCPQGRRTPGRLGVVGGVTNGSAVSG